MVTSAAGVPFIAKRNRELPLVSVVIPAFNCVRYVDEAIQSVLSQDYGNLELIVVDDGSTDGTYERAVSYGGCVKVLQQPNQGAGAARNRAVRESRGDILAFLDADDVWLPGKLTAQVAHLQRNPDVGVVYGRWADWLTQTDGSFSPAASYATPFDDESLDGSRSGWLYPRILLSSLIHIISAIIPRAVYDRVGGFDEGLRRGQDYDFWIKVTRMFRAHRLSMMVALYRHHGGNNTKRPQAQSNAYRLLARAVEQYGLTGPGGDTLSPREMNRRLADVCFRFGYLHLRRGDPSVAANAFLRSLRHYPLRGKAIVFLAAAATLCMVGR
jgi:glycosyltransferase involved in cell wall biosynthesis